jgi:hypothetical protein
VADQDEVGKKQECSLGCCVGCGKYGIAGFHLESVKSFSVMCWEFIDG